MGGMPVANALHMQKGRIGQGFLAGAIGGLVGAWTMNQLQGMLEKVMPMETDEPASRPRSKNDPESKMVVAVVSKRLLKQPLRDQETERLATVVHYLFGATMGGIYGVMAEVAPMTGVGLGIPFGVTLWLGAEGAAASMRGLAQAVDSRSPAAHARDLLTHTAFGLTTDLVRRAVQGVAR